MNRPAVLLAVTSGGDRWEDPSEDLLYMLLEDLVDERGGAFTIQRLDTPDRHTLDVHLDGDLFRVRRQEGHGAVPLAATSVELREVHAACTRWAFGLGDAEAERTRAMWGGFDGTLAWQEVSDSTDR
jgi:hypothetical protein